MNGRITARGRIAAVALLLTALVAGRASATPLGLVTTTPDISAFFLNFTFDSAGGVCGGTDYTLCYSADPAAISSYGLLPADITDFVPYTLAAAVDPLTGALLGPGAFAIGSYLTGNVVAVGYEMAGGAAVFDFIVAITGGSLAGQMAGPFAGALAPLCPSGACIGVTGTVFDWGTTGFGADLTTVTSADAFTDNFAPIPEPASIGLLGLGLFTLAAKLSRGRRV